jgi:hypothetical protein
MFLRELLYRTKRRLLNEALSKGSQTVLTHKSKANLFPAIGDALRDDAMHTPQYFFGQAAAVKKMTDEQAVTWFLEKLDAMEEAGYNGVRTSTDGKFNLWVATSYANGRDTWEDIKGKLQPIMYKFKVLKDANPSPLRPEHSSITNFSSIREAALYITTHYGNVLDELLKRKETSVAEKFNNKFARAFELVDNEDYKIFIVLNRCAAMKLARGAIWCTGMLHTDDHFIHYTSKAMVFVVLPKDAQHVDKAKGGRQIQGPEKYQFDAGGPYFMDIADDMQSRDFVKNRFPYLYKDVVGALQENKEDLTDIMINLSQDEKLLMDDRSKTLKYDVDNEIQKLRVFIDRGYMSEVERPPAPEVDPNAAPEAGAQPPQIQ